MKYEDIEEKYVQEISEKLDEYITFCAWLGFQQASRTEKQKELVIRTTRLREWMMSYTRKIGQPVYRQGVKNAMIEAKDPAAKKLDDIKLTKEQIREVRELSMSLRYELDSKINYYNLQGRKLIVKFELAKFREKNGFVEMKKQETFINPEEKRKSILMMDSKGRRITNRALMKITVGDAIWEMLMSGERSHYLSMGITHVQHLSVMDKRTSEICQDLNLKLRDIRRDKLPPMHPNCRSRIRPVDPVTNQPIRQVIRKNLS